MSALAKSPLFVVEDSGQDLARRTACIKVQRTRLGNSRKVSASQVDVDTDKTMLYISRRLFDCPEYKAIANFDADISRYLESVCRPFEKSVHLCPLSLLGQVDARLKQFAAKRPELVEAFVAVYPALCEQAPIASALCTTRAISCHSNRSGPRSPSTGATSASACPRNCARSRPSCGTRSAIKSHS